MLQKKYTLGLALSGGGMRAFAHLGVVKALYERNLMPEIISGTSMGAIVGALLADGYKPDEIAQMAIETNQSSQKFVQSKFSNESILSMSGLRHFLEHTLHAKNIEDLKIPLVIAATNIDLGRTDYFQKGELIEPIIASSSIPIIFPPVDIGGYHYVDGGVLANMPVKPIRQDCKIIIGVHANPIVINKEKLKGFVQIAERCFHLAIRANTLEDKKLCDLFIEPEGLEEFGILSLKKMKEIFELGYRRTVEFLDKNSISSIPSFSFANTKQ